MGQPSNETLPIEPTSTEDTSQTLTIESDGLTTSDDVSLNRTTSVATTGSFASIDAFELDTETQGDVVVSDSSDNELARIHGATEYERFLDDQITRGVEDLALEVRSAGLSVSNNYDKSGVMGTVKQAVHVGQQDVEFTATVAGQLAQHEHLTAENFDIT